MELNDPNVIIRYPFQVKTDTGLLTSALQMTATEWEVLSEKDKDLLIEDLAAAKVAHDSDPPKPSGPTTDYVESMGIDLLMRVTKLSDILRAEPYLSNRTLEKLRGQVSAMMTALEDLAR